MSHDHTCGPGCEHHPAPEVKARVMSREDVRKEIDWIRTRRFQKTAKPEELERMELFEAILTSRSAMLRKQIAEVLGIVLIGFKPGEFEHRRHMSRSSVMSALLGRGIHVIDGPEGLSIAQNKGPN